MSVGEQDCKGLGEGKKHDHRHREKKMITVNAANIFSLNTRGREGESENEESERGQIRKGEISRLHL